MHALVAAFAVLSRLVAQDAPMPTRPKTPAPVSFHGVRHLDGRDWGAVPRAPALDLQSFTAECWFQVDLPPGQSTHTLLSRLEPVGRDVFAGWYVKIEGGLGPYHAFFAVFDNDAGASVVHKGPIEPGAWHHLAAVFDGRELRLYLDGSLGGTSAYGKPVAYTGAPLTFASQAYARDAWLLHGSMAHARLSRGARYQANFTPARGPLEVDPTTIGYWPLNDDAGPTFRDLGPHALHGQWQRAPEPEREHLE